MNTWETVLVTALISAVAGTLAGARITRHRIRRDAPRFIPPATTAIRPVSDRKKDTAEPNHPAASAPHMFGLLGSAASALRAGVHAVGRAGRRRLPAAADPAATPALPFGHGSADAKGPGRSPGIDSSAAAASATSVSPLPPTLLRRAPALRAPAELQVAPSTLPAVPGPAAGPMRRTPALDILTWELEYGQAALRVSTASRDITVALPDVDGLRIGPEDADVMVPELAVDLLLGRSGFVWTVQRAGPPDLAVTLDEVPLTPVPMPWTSSRRLTAGAVTLTLENAPSADPWFDEPATEVGDPLVDLFAARANGYGLAIGMSDELYASTLATTALAAFDPRILDPARAAALVSLNVTLALRDARRARGDAAGEGRPRLAILGIDGRAELRAVANFDVSVWAITRHEVVLLARSSPEQATGPEVTPLEVSASPPLGDRPILLLTAGAPAATLAGRLAGFTTLTIGPKRLAQVIVSGPNGAVAAAAVLSRELHGSVAGSRWSA
jgi:hypothetical protein